jgi:hypothetical protein
VREEETTAHVSVRRARKNRDMATKKYRRWQVLQTVELGASAQDVWNVVGGFFTIHKWHPDIKCTEVPRLQTSQPAIRRVLTFPGQPKTTEELIDLCPGDYRYSYKWHAGAWGERVKDYRAEIRVFETELSKRSVLQWSSTFSYYEDALSEFYWNGFRALQQKFPLHHGASPIAKRKGPN